MDIYQQIWDADQAGNGIQPILEGQTGDPERGSVTVINRTDIDATTSILQNVQIPARKRLTYDRVLKLFDNYALEERAQEIETPEERQEVHDLLSAIIDTPPMQVAREYVANATGTIVSRDRWYGVLLEQWFRTFSQGGDPALTGFEHVIVGEQEGPKVQGYHYWYKYYLDDGLATSFDRDLFPGFDDDRIAYVRGIYKNGQENFPESVTISYKWRAPDYSRWTPGGDPQSIVRPLTKEIGGFFVGCSIEGLMAIGSVRAHVGARAPKEAVINGGRYNLKLFRSANDQHIRTFYPEFLGPAGGAVSGPVVTPGKPVQPEQPEGPVAVSAIRILAALVNPLGDDPQKETVTIINTGPTTQSLEAWRLVDANRRSYEIKEVTLGPGMATTILLPRNSIQLSNKGGEIRLVNRDGHTVHAVTYSKAQASDQGRTIVF